MYSYFFENHENQRRASFAGAPFPNTSTTPAILDAVTSNTPSPRYLVAGVGPLPAWVAARLVNHLPIWLRDYMLSATFYGKKAQATP